MVSMSKIFFGIVAFGSYKHIIKNLHFYFNKENEYVIHYNKKSSILNYLILKSKLKELKNVKVVRWNKVYWGTYSIIDTHIKLMNYFLSTSKCDIFCSLDNFAIPINIKKILNTTDDTIFLNLNQSDKCVFGEKHKTIYNKKINLKDNYCYHKYYKLLDKYYYYAGGKKYIYYIIIAFYNLFLNPINFLLFLCTLGKKGSIIEMNPFSNKIDYIDFEIKNPMTISGQFVLTRNQVSYMLNNSLFKKMLKFSKDKCSPEEWLIHNFWLNQKILKNNVGILYINKDITNLSSIKNMDLSDIVFIRYRNIWNSNLIELLAENKTYSKH